MAVARKILVAAFHMLQRAVPFADLGAGYLDRIDKHRTARRLVRRLDALGYDVMLRPKAAARAPSWPISTPGPAQPRELSGQPTTISAPCGRFRAEPLFGAYPHRAPSGCSRRAGRGMVA